MSALTTEKVLNDIRPFEAEYIADGDWWWGTEKSYSNAPLGFDVHVEITEDEKSYIAIVYPLVRNNVDKTHLEIASESLFNFTLSPTEGD